jgi:hypothetical protein
VVAFRAGERMLWVRKILLENPFELWGGAPELRD